MKKNRSELGKIKVKKKGLKVDELEDKVKFAIDAYKRAFDRYQKGTDSTKDWAIVIKALTAQKNEINDYIAVAHQNIGVIYATNENYSLAIESFIKALECNPDYPIAHNNLAIVYKKVGDMAAARKHQAEAKRLGYKFKSES